MQLYRMAHMHKHVFAKIKFIPNMLIFKCEWLISAKHTPAGGLSSALTLSWEQTKHPLPVCSLKHTEKLEREMFPRYPVLQQ